jgi:hypothetical protein
MPYYKDLTNQLHWLDDAMYENLLPAGAVQITDDEANAIISANTGNNSSEFKPPISALQLRMALNQMGLRSQVEEIVAAGDQNLKDWYQFSFSFARDNSNVLAIETELQLDKTQFDDLWNLGITLQ